MTDHETTGPNTAPEDTFVPLEDRVFVGRRMLTASIIGLVVLAVTGLAVGWSVNQWLASHDDSGAPLPPAARASEIPANTSTLRAEQRIERQRYEAQQRDLLSRYEWIDQERGVARIPIDRAIDVLQSQKQERK